MPGTRPLSVCCQNVHAGHGAGTVGQPQRPDFSTFRRAAAPQPFDQRNEQNRGAEHDRQFEKTGKTGRPALSGQPLQRADGFLGCGDFREGLARIVEQRGNPGAEQHESGGVKPHFQDLAESLVAHGPHPASTLDEMKARDR